MTRRAARIGIAVGAVAALFGAAIGVVAWVRSDDGAGRAAGPSTTAPSGSNPFRIGRPLVIPHGGGDGLYPEDTLLAYTETMAMGADVVDVDLQLAGDGTVIAFHDPTVDRITGATGNVAEMTYAQLRVLDAGWSFHPAGKPDDHPFRGKGIVIPTFESILQQFPHALLSLDLKNESMAMIAPVCDLLVRYGRHGDVFVGSNSDAQILAFRQQCPSVRTSATMVDVRAARAARSADDTAWVPVVFVDQPPYRSSNGRVNVDAASLAFAHAHDIAILPWVVNDPADMRTLIGLGVDGIYTSYPDVLLKLLGRYHAPPAA